MCSRSLLLGRVAPECKNWCSNRALARIGVDTRGGVALPGIRRYMRALASRRLRCLYITVPHPGDNDNTPPGWVFSIIGEVQTPRDASTCNYADGIISKATICVVCYSKTCFGDNSAGKIVPGGVFPHHLVTVYGIDMFTLLEVHSGVWAQSAWDQCGISLAVVYELVVAFLPECVILFLDLSIHRERGWTCGEVGRSKGMCLKFARKKKNHK